MTARIVMHVDMDAFYASVELRRPARAARHAGDRRRLPAGGGAVGQLRGARPRRPVGHAVDPGPPAGPRATFVSPDFDSYTAVSKAIVEVFGSVTSVVEAASIDEAFLDLTGSVRMLGSRRP